MGPEIKKKIHENISIFSRRQTKDCGHESMEPVKSIQRGIHISLRLVGRDSDEPDHINIIITILLQSLNVITIGLQKL